VSISTTAGQTINVVPNYGGVKIVVECSEDVCESVEYGLSESEFLALVIQGSAALLAGSR
jgi:hypothetical protein